MHKPKAPSRFPSGTSLSACTGSAHEHPVHRAVLALGSNLGERNDTLSEAVADLVDRPEVRLLAVSPVVQTKAVGGPAGQPDFLNMVISVETTLEPLELLRHCQAVENKHHRVREVRWGPRTLDVDIIVYGDLHQRRSRC